jgi:uncharacterized protein
MPFSVRPLPSIAIQFPVTLVLTIVCLAASAWAGNKADEAYDQEDCATAVSEMRPLAEDGNAAAQVNLGLHYYNGQGVPQNYVLARQWWEKAAAQGHAGAQVSLGTLSLMGYGVPKDYQQAMRWFRLAADQDDALAQMKLGVIYERGDGIPPDFVQAHKWYNLAAAKGEKDSAVQRELLSKRMTPDQIAEAQQVAREWKPKGK